MRVQTMTERTTRSSASPQAPPGMSRSAGGLWGLLRAAAASGCCVVEHGSAGRDGVETVQVHGNFLGCMRVQWLRRCEVERSSCGGCSPAKLMRTVAYHWRRYWGHGSGIA